MDPMVQGQLKEWFLMVGFFASLGWVIYILTMSFRRRQQNAMQKHVLDKFSSAQDFAEFMKSPAGQTYLASFTETAADPKDTILNSIKIGIVLLFLGLGIYAMDVPSLRSFAEGAGAIVTCVGLGFIVSAGVSHWLAKKIRAGEKG